LYVSSVDVDVLLDENYLRCVVGVCFCMVGVSFEDIVSVLMERGGLSRDEIDVRVDEKLDALSGLISREGAAHIIANDLGIKLVDLSSDRLKIRELFSGMSSVDVVGRVLDKYELREFQRSGSTGKVFSVVVGDETGRIRVVFWDSLAEEAQGVVVGDVLFLKGAYSRENRIGYLEVHLGSRSGFEVNPEGVSVNVQEYNSAVLRKRLSEVKEDDGLVEVMGTLVQVYGMNFFEVCSVCSRRARMRDGVFYCNQHNVVEPKFSCVMNILLDDGSDSVRMALFSDQIKQLLEKSSDNELLKFKGDDDVFEDLKHDLLGAFLKIEGRVNKNDITNSLEIVVRKVCKADPGQEIEIVKKKGEQ